MAHLVNLGAEVADVRGIRFRDGRDALDDVNAVAAQRVDLGSSYYRHRRRHVEGSVEHLAVEERGRGGPLSGVSRGGGWVSRSFCFTSVRFHDAGGQETVAEGDAFSSSSFSSLSATSCCARPLPFVACV